MDKMDTNYNVIGVIKSQLCAMIANSEKVREALDYKGSNSKDYDPEDPLSLIYNCIFPYLQHPETITTTEPLVFVGTKLSENPRNPYLVNTIVNIVCNVDKDDIRTRKGYFRKDLLEMGCLCYTKPDWVIDEIIKCLSSFKGTWIGDIENVETTEYAMNNTRYVREVVFRLKDVNIGKLLQNG